MKQREKRIVVVAEPAIKPVPAAVLKWLKMMKDFCIQVSIKMSVIIVASVKKSVPSREKMYLHQESSQSWRLRLIAGMMKY